MEPVSIPAQETDLGRGLKVLWADIFSPSQGCGFGGAAAMRHNRAIQTCVRTLDPRWPR